MVKKVLIIGGGVTGLATAYELQKWKDKTQNQVTLTLAEANEQLGGKIKSVRDQGFIMESGADSVVIRKARGMNFIEELGLEGELVYNATGRSYILVDGELKMIPLDSIFGIPMSIESLATSPLVSAEGKVAALKDLYTKNEEFTETDSIGDFLEFFLGKELVEKQIAPVLSGVYSGTLHELSIQSTLPYLVQYKNEYGSIIKGLEANREKFQSGNERKFFSFKNGLDTLITAYESALKDVDIIKETKVEKIRKANGRYEIYFHTGEVVHADYVVLTTPHLVTNQILQYEELEPMFSSLKTNSMMSVYLGFDIPDHRLPKEGTGFINPIQDDVKCHACTWSSRKWEHTSKQGNMLVRLFYKGDQYQSMSENELLQLARQDVAKSLRVFEEPVTTLLTNWAEQMPKYQINHEKTVRSLESSLENHYPGVHLAGCSYYGVGIADCIANGQETAQRIIDKIEC